MSLNVVHPSKTISHNSCSIMKLIIGYYEVFTANRFLIDALQVKLDHQVISYITAGEQIERIK